MLCMLLHCFNAVCKGTASSVSEEKAEDGKNMEYIASAFIPAAVLLCTALLTFSKKASFDDFLRGTESGITVIFRLLPTLIVLVVSVSMLSASGAVDFISSLLAPTFERLGIPTGMLPLIIMRPFSGSGSNAMIADIFDKYGADSLTAKAASVLLGSSETILYVFAVYFSAAGIKKTRHALPAAFLSMIFCVFLSSLICRLMFG